MSVSGKRVLVTGGSSGIGEAIVERLAAEGAGVTVASRSEPPALPASAAWVATDVADSAAVGSLFGEHGPFDAVVNNAGVQVEKTVAETTDDEYDLVMNVNVRGVFLCSREAVRQMQPAGGGSIVNIASVAASTADHGMAVYNASKGAVLSLTRAIAVDHGRDGIRCNAVSPGWIMTALADAAFDLADDPAAARDAAIAKHPVGRMGEPADVAGLVAWLISDDSAFASGSNFTIDGGLTAQSPISPD